jgi:membrane protein YdbS with pleckstrin-like domain
MNYQVTCFCGHSFLINGQQVSKTVTCPACKRELLPVVSAAGQTDPADTPIPNDVLATPVDVPPPTSASTEPTKRCPFCGEVILAVAKKCKHCGEFLDRSVPHPDPVVAAAKDAPPVFALSVSQWDNFWKYLICAALAVLVCGGFIVAAERKMISPEVASLGVPVTLAVIAFAAWILYLTVKNSRCFIRPTRIDTEVGVLSKEITTVELFRITDMDFKQSLFERVLGIGTIKISSTDPKTPELVLYQIPKARRVHKYLQDQIPVATKQRGAVFYER